MLSRVLTILSILSSMFIHSQETKFKVNNTSINSSYAELGVHFKDAQTLIYASSKKTEDDSAFKKVRRKRQRQKYIAIYESLMMENGDLIDQSRFLDQTQQNIELSDFAIAPDKKTIYFTWNNYQPYMIDTIEVYWSNTRIMKGTITAENEIDIPNAHPLPFVNDKNNFKNIALSPDGKTLFFSADLPRGSGGMDLYKVAILGNDRYSEPENLGNEVNSSQDEMFPFIDAANNLYFASYGHRGRGGLDIFKSRQVNGEFLEIEQLDEPINSKADDFGFIIDAQTQKGYFVSNRSEGKGNVDIYSFEPDIPECIQTISALFVHSETSEQLRNVQVSVISETGDILNSLFVTELKSAAIPIKCESNVTLRIEKEGFETLETSISTDTTFDKEIPKEFQLVEIPCTQFITGDILHKLELQPIMESTVSVYVNDTVFNEQILSASNSFNIEVPCNTDYNLVVSKDGYETVSAVIKTGNQLNEKHTKNILLAPRICTQDMQVTVLNAESSTAVTKFKARLFSDGNLLDEKSIINGNQFSFELNCDTSFTLEIEKEGFETYETSISTDTSFDKDFSKEVQLIEIPCTQLITGDVLHKLELQPLMESTVSVYVNGALFKEQVLTGSNTFSLKVPCNTEYNLVVSKNGFESVSSINKTGTQLDQQHAKNILLAPRICVQDMQVTVLNAESSTAVTKFKARLLRNGNLIDEKNIVNGNQFSFGLNCDSAFTIEIEKTGFETFTLNQVTNNNYDWNFEETVNLVPLPCEQFVVFEPLNSNDQEALKAAQIEIKSSGTRVGTALGSTDKVSIPCNTDVSLILNSPGFQSKTISIKSTNEFQRIYNQRISFEPIVCEQDFSITVADANTKTGLSNFDVVLKNGKVEEKVIKNGSLANFKLKCDSNYTFTISKMNYESSEISIQTTGINGAVLSETVFLTPTVCEQTIAGRITDIDTGEALSNALVIINSGNTFSKQLNLDEKGQFSFTAECENIYNLKVSLLDYDSKDLKVTTTSIRNETSQHHIKLQRDLEFSTVAGKRLINTNNIVFELNKVDITKVTAIELNKVVALLTKYPDLKLLVKSHTDSRAPDQLNLNLTEGRAAAIREYLLSKGIDTTRVQAKGLGETELLNKCANGVKCSEEEHRKNRRTEFIVSN